MWTGVLSSAEAPSVSESGEKAGGRGWREGGTGFLSRERRKEEGDREEDETRGGEGRWEGKE